MLDKHTNLATALLTAIKNRGLDGFYNLEEDLLTGKADTGALVKLLQVRVLAAVSVHCRHRHLTYGLTKSITASSSLLATAQYSLVYFPTGCCLM